MEPQNPDWCERLGHLYHLHAGVGPGRKRNKASAAHALKEWQAALALLQDDRERFYLLTKMAPGAVDAGRLREAVRYAREALRFASRFSEDWNHGNAVHHAHLALGRVALRRRQVSKARLHLIASARHKGSPQLDSFGPSQDLAVELLARGATKTVLRYLELCRTFWVMGHPQIDTWIKSIKESGTTTFLPVFDRQ
jgi:hypothetical protein